MFRRHRAYLQRAVNRYLGLRVLRPDAGRARRTRTSGQCLAAAHAMKAPRPTGAPSALALASWWDRSTAARSSGVRRTQKFSPRRRPFESCIHRLCAAGIAESTGQKSGSHGFPEPWPQTMSRKTRSVQRRRRPRTTAAPAISAPTSQPDGRALPELELGAGVVPASSGDHGHGRASLRCSG